MRPPELNELFQELLASNGGSGYGISVTGAAPDLSTIDVEFRFLAGRIYCCAEPGCHLPWNSERLLRLAAERSIHLPDDVRVQWHCVVEEGACLECLAALRIPTESRGYEFDAVTPSPDCLAPRTNSLAYRPT